MSFAFVDQRTRGKTMAANSQNNLRHGFGNLALDDDGRVRLKQNKNRCFAPNKMKESMKNSIQLLNHNFLAGQWLPTLATSALLVAAVSPARSDETNIWNSVIIPPVVQTRPYGLTYAEWLAKWWQWSLAFPVSADPENGTADISSKQSGDVWFLPAPLGGGTATRA